MSNLINIIQGDDEFQRYKMPEVEINHSNKKFTIIKNSDIISKHLHMKEDILCKFISLEKNTNNKKNKLNGLFEKIEIQKIIYDFIENFVLCDKCGLPELKHKAYDKNILNKCLSCGEKYLTKSNHKIKNYWSNKYPKKFNHKKFSTYQPEENNFQITLHDEKKHAEKLEYLLDENYASAVHLDEIKSFSLFLENKYTDEQIYEKIKLLKLAYSLNQRKMSGMLFLLLDLSSFENLQGSIKKNSHIFRKFITDCEMFLKLFETLLEKHQYYLERSYVLMNLLYDNEIFTEEQLIQWFDTQSYDDLYNTFKSKSKVFIDWLKECNEYEL